MTITSDSYMVEGMTLKLWGGAGGLNASGPSYSHETIIELFFFFGGGVFFLSFFGFCLVGHPEWVTTIRVLVTFQVVPGTNTICGHLWYKVLLLSYLNSMSNPPLYQQGIYLLRSSVV